MSPEISIRTEKVEQKPFVIRAHHLGHFRLLVKGQDIWNAPAREPMSPAEVAARITQAVKSDESEEYAMDVLGDTTENLSTHTQKLKIIFETFVSLPDDYPVNITEHISDEICKACLTGKHCGATPPKRSDFNEGLNLAEKIQNLFHDTFIEPRGPEQGQLNWFLHETMELRLKKPTIQKERIIYSDTGKRKVVRKAVTTAGVTKKVIAQIE